MGHLALMHPGRPPIIAARAARPLESITPPDAVAAARCERRVVASGGRARRANSVQGTARELYRKASMYSCSDHEAAVSPAGCHRVSDHQYRALLG